MLVISSSVGMLYGILGNSTNLGPAVALDGVLVVSISSLEKRLIGTSTSSDDSDLSTYEGRNSLLSSRRKTKTGGSLIIIVGYDNSKGSGSTCERTAVTDLGLNIAHNGSLRDSRKGKTVSYREGCLLSAEDVLSSVHTFGCDHELIVPLVTVSVKELNSCHRSSTTRVMDDLLDYSTDISMLLSVVDSTKLNRTLTGAIMRHENGGLSLPLCLLQYTIIMYYSILRWTSHHGSNNAFRTMSNYN
jgi:hypothetical protein